MPGFVLTNKAIADLKEIGRYTQNLWGRDQRNKYLTMLDSCFHQLTANPLKGQDCSEIRHGYRKLNVGAHLVFYHQQPDDTIEIVRILHGRMDVDAHLTEV